MEEGPEKTRILQGVILRGRVPTTYDRTESKWRTPKDTVLFSQNDKQFIEDAIEVQSITGHDHGAKTRRILQDSELMAGLQNGKLELLRPVDYRSEPLAEP